MTPSRPHEYAAFAIRRAGELRRRAQASTLDKRAALLRRARGLIEAAKTYRTKDMGGRPLTWFVRDAQHFVKNHT